jgi:hypothetical protein
MSLALRVSQVAIHTKWCGGVRLDHLASLLGLPPHDDRLMRAVWVAQRWGLVNLDHGWVMADRVMIEKKGKRS